MNYKETNCNKIIEDVYKEPQINKLIKCIKPEHLQEELKQEFAVILLEYDCIKLLKIKEEGKLIKFAASIIWKMGTLQKSAFYKKFKKIHFIEFEEKESVELNEEIPDEFIDKAKEILKNKMLINANEAHESMIFLKYVELQSCKKVADFFSIPRLHVFQVVNNVKKELKKNIHK